MKPFIWKYFFFVAVVAFNLYAAYNHIPTIQSLQNNLLIAISLLFLLFVVKFDLFNLVLLWILCVLFGGIGIVKLPPFPALEPHRFVWILIFIILMFEIITRKRKRILPFSSAEVAMLMLSIYCLSSMILAGLLYDKEGLKFSLLLSSFIMPFSMFFIAKQVVDNEQKIHKLFICFIIIGFYLGLTGIFEYYRLNYLVFPKYILSYKGTHTGSARGPFLNPDVEGVVIGMIGLIAIYCFFYVFKGWKKLFIGTTIILMLITLIFTFIRATWLGFFLASLMSSVYLPKMRKSLMFGLLLIIIYVLMAYSVGLMRPVYDTVGAPDKSVFEKVATKTMAMSSIYGRIQIFVATFNAFIDRPFFGFGYTSFAKILPKYFQTIEGIPYESVATSHNFWTTLLVELGLVGFSIYFLMLVAIFKDSLALYRKLPYEGFIGKRLVVIFWGLSIAYIVKVQFAEVRYFLFPNALLFIMAGVVCGLNQRISAGDKTRKIEYPISGKEVMRGSYKTGGTTFQ